MLLWQLRAEVAQRDATIAQRDATIRLLEAEIEQRDQKLGAMAARIAELQAQLLRHFKVPPIKTSQDRLPHEQPRHHGKTKRKRGGQPGHPGHARALLPADKVTERVTLIPDRCSDCGQVLSGTDPAPFIHQVVEVPPLCPKVTEYQCHRLVCPGCGKGTRAPLPEGVALSAFGPRLCWLVAILSGKYHLSKRMVEEMLSDFLGVTLSLGSVSALEKTVTQALCKPACEAMAALKTSAVVHQDETGWRQEHKKAWLWVAVTETVTVFVIDRHRSQKVSKEMIGQAYGGTVVSDRWSAYLWLPDEQRQLCWSHLLRDFEELVAVGGDGARLGKELYQQARRLFRYWHRVREKTLPFCALARKMKPVRREVKNLLVDGVRYFTGKAKSLSRELLGHEPALWRFVTTPGVEPTNNVAERALRQAVLWRRGSFGTQSEAGSTFVARILTVIATLKQHGRNVLEYVTAACQAQLLGQQAPSLLPCPA